MRRIYLFIVLTLCSVGYLNAQNYVQIANVSGTELSSSELNSLQVKSNEVINLLSNQLRNDFKIIDMGIYRYSDYMSGILSIDSILNYAKQQNVSPYNFIFGSIEQTDQGKARIIIDYNFPEFDIFECLTEAQIKSELKLIEYEINQKIGTPFNYFEVRIEMLSLIKSTFEKFSECCSDGARTSCSLCFSDKARRLSLVEGFYQPFKIDEIIPPPAAPIGSQYVSDETLGMNIKLAGQDINLVENINNFFNSIEDNPFSVKITITNNDAFCD